MNTYLTETAYQRWVRQQLASLSIHEAALDALRARVHALSYSVDLEEISQTIDEVVENIEALIPRLFSPEEKPLVGLEKLLENVKVLVNIICRVQGKEDHYLGVYHEEKERILALQRQFNFNHRLADIQEKIEAFEEYGVKSG
jgi:Na+/phosphate symporter